MGTFVKPLALVALCLCISAELTNVQASQPDTSSDMTPASPPDAPPCGPACSPQDPSPKSSEEDESGWRGRKSMKQVVEIDGSFQIRIDQEMLMKMGMQKMEDDCKNRCKCKGEESSMEDDCKNRRCKCEDDEEEDSLMEDDSEENLSECVNIFSSKEDKSKEGKGDQSAEGKSSADDDSKDGSGKKSEGKRARRRKVRKGVKWISIGRKRFRTG